VQSVRGMLENPTEAVNDQSFFESIDSVMENSKVEHTHTPLLLFSPVRFFDQPPLVPELLSSRKAFCVVNRNRKFKFRKFKQLFLPVKTHYMLT